ncbi:MAG: hypothetical protein ABIQ58_00845 [Candidatus Limnocylindrales bacterium]
MHIRSRRRAAVLSLLVLALAACGQAGSNPAGTTRATAGTASSSASSRASSRASSGVVPSTAIPSAGSVEPVSSADPPASQTETAWGTIWDGVPEGFPRFPGSTSADDATAEPVSDVYAIPTGDPAEIAGWLQTSMETATYSTEGLSGPLEDGSFVLDSVGDAGCRIQTSVLPQGGLVLVTVRYGAACPAA